MLQVTNDDVLNAKVECFKRGIFDFIVKRDGKHHKKQEEALQILTDDKTEEFAYGGAAGGAKSWTGATWLGFSCLLYPGSRWFIGRNELKRITESTLITFFKASSQYGFSHRYKFNAQRNFILFDNGSRIDLLDLKYMPSDELFERFGSTEYTGGWIEEGGEVNFGAYEVLKARIGRHFNDKYNLIPKIFITCNPKKNWLYKEFYKPFKEGVLDSVQKFLQAFVTDNPFIESGYVDRLRRTKNKAQKKRLLFGEWEYDDDPATIISYDAIQDYWNGKQVKAEGSKYLTIDVARKGKDKTVFRVWYGWVCIKRHAMPKSLINEIVDKAEELQYTYGISNSHTIADEDGVGGGVVDYLKCKGFVNNSKPIKEFDQHTGEVYDNYDNLKSQCSIRMGEKIESREVVEICDDPQIIEIVNEEMEQVKEKDIDKDGKRGIIPKDKVKEHIGRSPDEWDTIMMRYWFELGVEQDIDISWR